MARDCPGDASLLSDRYLLGLFALLPGAWGNFLRINRVDNHFVFVHGYRLHITWRIG